MSEIKKDILSRIGLFYVLIALFGVIILGRILYLQLVEGSLWKSKALALSQKNIIIPPMRGDILSSDGKVLATSVPYYEIRIDFRAQGLKKELFYKNIDSLSLCLSQLFNDKSALDYKKDLVEQYKQGNRYYLLKRRINHEEFKQLKTFPLFRMGQNTSGFIVIQNYYRAKPFGMLASRTLGYTSADRVVVGIEGAFDHYLRGKEGIQFMQRLSGNVWMPINNGNAIEPQDGYDVVTTLDVNLQDVAHHSLLSHLQKNKAEHGCAIVMETNTGYIKAIVNLEYDSTLQNYIEKFNYAIGESAEPGSVFKLVSMIAALDEGYVKITDTINTGNGETEYCGVKMKDSHEAGFGKISVADVFAYSSNVGTSKIITTYFSENPQTYVNRIYNLKLNEKLGLDIKGEGIPVVKDASDTSWSGITLPWMSIGYEVKLTPMQIVTLYNAVANEGRMVKPMLVKELRYRGEVVKKFESQVINPAICSQSTLNDLKIILKRVVEKGTAKNLNGTIYKIAGKTGTAQIARGKKGYKDENAQKTYRASFVGYFPADNPKYTCMVVVSSPSQSVYYGNVVAGPIFKEIADDIYATHIDLQQDINNLSQTTHDKPVIKSGFSADMVKLIHLLKIDSLNIPSSKWIQTNCSKEKIGFKPLIISRSVMPNVTGMGLRDALHILGNSGLEIRVIGRGKVIKQSLPNGTSFQKGDLVYLELG